MADINNQTPEQVAATVTAEEERKAKKLANDKRLKKLHRDEAEARVNLAVEFLAYMKAQKHYDKLEPKFQEFLVRLTQPIVGKGTTSTFTVLFGDTPKVGQKVSLLEVFQKTMKGKAQIDSLLEKKWKPAGYIVEFEPSSNPSEPLKASYVIKELPKN